MKDDYKDNYLNHSKDKRKKSKNKNLDMIEEENNSLNHDFNSNLPESNYYKQFHRLHDGNSRKNYNEKRKKGTYYKKEEEDEDEDEEELKNEEKYNYDNKRQNQKINRNLQLLNLLKKNINRNEKKIDKIIEEKNKEKDELDKNDELQNEENKINYIKRAGFVSFIKENKTKNDKIEKNDKNIKNNINNNIKNDNNKDDDIKNREEEKKKKLLKIFENQRFNKFKKKEKEVEKADKKEEEYDEENNESKSMKNRKNNQNSSFVSNQNPVRKGIQNFHISTSRELRLMHSKSKENLKMREREKNKDKEESKKEIRNKKEDKYTEIPSEQRNKLTINISKKNIKSMNDNSNNSSEIKTFRNNNTNSNKNNDSSDKKSSKNNFSDKKSVRSYNSNNKNKYNNDENNEEKEKENEKEESFFKINNKQDKKEEMKDLSNNKDNNKDNNSINNSINNSNIKRDKNSTKETKKDISKYFLNNEENINNSSSKKGALKILELLKAKKREENENLLRSRSQDITVKGKKDKDNSREEKKEIEDEKIMDIQKPKNKDNYYSYTYRKSEEDKQKSSKKHSESKIDANSLPKKIYRDEENEDEDDYKYHESHNKTQHKFRTHKKINYDIINESENMNINIKKNYISNLSKKNVNLNDYLELNDVQNNSKRKTINYINNANNIRKKCNKKLKGYNYINESINESSNNYNSGIIEPQNSETKRNLKEKILDKSYDITQSIKTPGAKMMLNNSKYNSINANSNVYEPKKIINNSPKGIISYEKNNDINKSRIYSRINSNIINSSYTAYIRKSPGRFKKMKNNNNSNNIKNRKKNLFNNLSKNNNNKNSNTNNNINGLGGLELSSIYGINTSKDTFTSNTNDYTNNNDSSNNNKNKNNKNNPSDNNTKENSMLFNLEDLMVLEERLNEITCSLETNTNIEKKCFNFWNYYYNCSLYKILEKIFPNEEDSNIVRLSINYELMSIMVCYEFSFQIQKEDEDICLLLIDLIYLNHNNLMIICEYILTKIAPENKDNIWVLKLQELVNNLKISQIKELQSNYSLTPINKIDNNINKLIKKLKNILYNYTTEFSHILKKFLQKLETKTYEEINEFFRLNILRVNNFEGSIVASTYLKKNKDFNPVPAPYIKEPSNRPYTLVLDLDETLINFKIKNSKEGTLCARPFLFGFLEEMGHYYELILWTSATESYANSLIDAIECDKTYFDYVFYREHAIIVGDDFVKDLNRIGRSLDKIIIVDDMPQNFRLQKQNGITIKPFLGDDNNDMALYDLLPILKRIAEEGNDVRTELAKYRDEIVKKITSNISKHNI